MYDVFFNLSYLSVPFISNYDDIIANEGDRKKEKVKHRYNQHYFALVLIVIILLYIMNEQ